MNPAHSPYTDPNTVLSFNDQVGDSLMGWDWLLSLLDKIADNYISLETERLTADGDCARWQWHFEVPHGSELMLATALEKQAATIRSIFETRKAEPCKEQAKQFTQTTTAANWSALRTARRLLNAAGQRIRRTVWTN